MLTNKDIIEALVNVGYTMKEINSITKISTKILNKMKKNEEVDEDSENQINHFFRMNMQQVNVDNFKDEQFRNSHLIMTPNGFKKVIEFNEEGLQHCYKINFDNFSIIASDKHQIQLTNDKWTTIDKLKENSEIKVYDEQKNVKSISEIGDITCYSIIVEDNEYYLDGVVSK